MSPTGLQKIGTMKSESEKRLKLDKIGEWSELKLDILKKYAEAYCTILKARNLHPVYVDGFAGAGTHVRKKTGELVKGSPLNALEIQPSFEEFHLIDTDQSKIEELKRQTTGVKQVSGGRVSHVAPTFISPESIHPFHILF